jgi:putative ABC transport system permease protein
MSIRDMKSRGRGMSVLGRLTGMGVAGSLTLALLAGGCVLAAATGPREAQRTGLLGVGQLMDTLSPLDKAIVASSSSGAISSIFNQDTVLTPRNLDDVTAQLRRDFGSGALPLAARSADWVGMTPDLYSAESPLPSLNGIPAKLEVAFRYPLAGHLRLVAGTMPNTRPREKEANLPHPVIDIPVVVTQQTAATFALRPGSQVVTAAPYNASIPVPDGAPPPPPPTAPTVIRLDVTGIVEPTDPGSTFWAADPLLAAPNLFKGQSTVWEAAVIADPGDFAVIQETFGQSHLGVQWELPIDTTGLHAEAPALYSQVNQMTNTLPQLAGPMEPIASVMSVSSGLLQPLAALVQASNGVNALLWMVYAGLAVAGIVMMLLAARMISARRSAEMAVRRARGASLAQLFLAGFLGAAVACFPAAALAWAVAVLLVPVSGPVGWVAWWPGIATLVVAAVGPGVAAAWQHRLPRRRAGWGGLGRARRRRRWANRVTFEVTACAAAVGAITVVRLQTGAGDLYTSSAPVLVAVPVVIVVLRLYQLLLRGLARASARQRGVTGFVGLARAARAAVTLGLPAMTLVLALTMAAFTIMLRDAVVRGEVAASWQETGADVVIASPGVQAGSAASLISPAAVRAIAAVPGVQHSATALELPLTLTGGEQVTAIAVDPASYAALVASTEGFPAVNPVLLTERPGQQVVPALASPQAAAYFSGHERAATFAQPGLPALRVRVSGELQSTPALPSGGAFVVLPLSAIGSAGIPGSGASPPVNLMLLTGPSIDMARLRAVAAAGLPGGAAPSITSRSQALQALAGAPLQAGTFLIFTLAIVFAAALALAVMLLELALGTADRELTIARLAVMGLAEGQRVRLAALEMVPAIAASAVAAVACAIALTRLVAPAVNLSAFTHSQASVPLRPDFASFLLPLAGLLVVTVIALAYEIRSGRRRVTVSLRA